MMEWWSDLGLLNQVFYAGAGLFSLIFIWQFVMMLIGLSHGGDLDVDVHGDFDADAGGDFDVDGDGDVDVHVDALEAHSMHDAAESTAAFHILSVRAILAFFTLFFWAGAMYLEVGKTVSQSLLLAMAWGAAAWAVVAVLLHWLRKLAETGNRRLTTALGQPGTVYVDIPAGGQGEVRVLVSGVVSLVKARAPGGQAVKAGTPVTVTKLLGVNSVQVAPAGEKDKQQEKQA